MAWLIDSWDTFLFWLPALLAVLDLVVSIPSVIWVLMTKKESTSAVAWILLIILLPVLGAILLFFFGYNHVSRPLKRKRKHKLLYQPPPNPAGYVDSSPNWEAAVPTNDPIARDTINGQLARLAHRFGAYSVTMTNQIDFYFEGRPAFDAMLASIAAARHHLHLEFFIFQPDELGRQFLEVLTERARAGVEVRLLYDAMGSHRLRSRLLRPLHEAGGKSSVFLPINPFRRRLQVNMRNHRKILVADGAIGFLGGLNIGDEYLGKKRLGFWRDTHLRIRGPAVVDLQRVFSEDWNFAAGEVLTDQGKADASKHYFRSENAGGPYPMQIIDSGPDRDIKGLREVIFAGILKAKKRVWIASPYFVPDAGLLDALRLAAFSGIDVRFLGQLRPDKWIPQFAARYYFDQVIPAGVKVYLYKKGMMHAKTILIDDDWATVGTANFDNRSMFLNFEVNCVLYSQPAVAILEQAFERDFADAQRLEMSSFGARPFLGRLAENACRLMSPIL